MYDLSHSHLKQYNIFYIVEHLLFHISLLLWYLIHIYHLLSIFLIQSLRLYMF